MGVIKIVLAACLTTFFINNGYCEEVANNSRDESFVEALQLAGVTVLLYGALNGIGSQDPKAYGEFVIAVSPVMATFGVDSPQSTIWDGLLVGGLVAGFGLYNRNVLSAKEYSKTEVFNRNMLITALPLAGSFLLSALSDKSTHNAERPLSLQYDGNAYVMSYTLRF